MRRTRSRTGVTPLEVLLFVLVIGLGIWTYTLNTRLSQVDARGKALRDWIGTADGPETNAPGGLTTWLINLKKHVADHVSQPVTGPGAAHTGAPDQHLDPPPPPPW